MKIEQVINILSAIKSLTDEDLRLEIQLYDGESQYVTAKLTAIQILDNGPICLQGVEANPQ
jgi:hypothetical protein